MKMQVRGMPDPHMFVEKKMEAEKLEKMIKNINRKIEIASVTAKEARVVIRNNAGYINNVDMGDLEYQ